jgi:tetratricopeptide (TPR) repeat protein/type II secretory pathway predicted ATPase ExeA
LAPAIRRARLELYNDKSRRAAFDQTISLEDWLLPVVYQNRASQLPLVPFASIEEKDAFLQRLDRRYRAPKPTYDFVGRDVDILEIENRLLNESAEDANILLIQGMGGAGKTTLLKHLMEWWQTTGLVDEVIYFGYDDKAYTTAQIIDAVARELYGKAYHHEFSPLSDAAKRVELTQKLNSERHLLVLDNLESITGTALAIQHTLDEKEQARLRDFIASLAGGRSLVLLGSRGKEEWLVGRFGKSPYELPGLDPEAASNLTERILQKIGQADLPADPDHAEPLRQLLKLLAGYPLALEVILPNLARQRPAGLLAAFTGGVGGLDKETSGELWQDKTTSILRCVEYSHSNLSPAAQALLMCLFPFTGVVNAEWLHQYTQQLQQQPALAELPYEQWGAVLTEAMNWGLLTPHEAGGGYLRLQPILPYFLRQRQHDPAQAEFRAAVESAFRAHYHGIGGALAELIRSKVSQQQQTGKALTRIEFENLVTGLKIALDQRSVFFGAFDALEEYLDREQASKDRINLCQWVLSVIDQYTSEQLEGEIGVHFFSANDRLAGAQLQAKNLEQARVAYENGLDIASKSNDDHVRKIGKASTYHQLGRVAQEQRQWATAEAHYQQALQIKIEFNDRYSQASTYHQLGIVAQEQRQWATAESHYQQALQITIEFNDRYSQAGTYHQLGRVAEEQRQWATAEAYYQQALQIKIEFNDATARHEPTTSWAGWPRNSGSGRRPKPITSRPCKSSSNSMTATARLLPTTSWVRWRRNSGSGRRPKPITKRPCKSSSNSMTATARHPPTTSWAWWPRHSGSGRRPKPITSKPCKSSSNSMTATAREVQLTN